MIESPSDHHQKYEMTSKKIKKNNVFFLHSLIFLLFMKIMKNILQPNGNSRNNKINHFHFDEFFVNLLLWVYLTCFEFTIFLKKYLVKTNLKS